MQPARRLPSHRFGWGNVLAASGLVVLVLVVFLASLRHGFVNLDDDIYVYENSHVLTGLNWGNVQWSFGTLAAGFWQPLTWLSLMLDHQLFGLRAGGYHASALLLHAANAILLFLLLRRLTGVMWRSLLVAALFAVHPLHVESVAWVAERKDVLSAFFCLLALLAYAAYAQRRSALASAPAAALFYALALLAFAGGLASKTTIVTLPFLLLLLDYWPLRRLKLFPIKSQWPLWLEKLPFFAAASVAGLLTILAEKSTEALPTTGEFPFPLRLGNAIISYARYLCLTIWPHDLAAFYPYPPRLSTLVLASSASLLLIVSVLVWRGARARPYLAFGWTWYLLTLLPMIGLVQVGYYAYADRHTYLPLIGVFVMLAWGIEEISRRGPLLKPALVATAAIGLAALATLAFRQVQYWHDSGTLFSRALEVTKGNYLAYNNLGLFLAEKGRFDDAIANYRVSFDLARTWRPLHNLGLALAAQGHFDAAIAEYRAALEFAPRNPQLHLDLALAQVRSGRLDDAVHHARLALEQSPRDPRILNNLGTILLEQGKFAEAAGYFQTLLRLDPSHPFVHANLGNALAGQNLFSQAAREYRQFLVRNPADPRARLSLARTLLALDQLSDARVELETALALDPGNAEARELREILPAATTNRPGKKPQTDSH